jgi:[ribosomal protein S5]-alanine N-acetyltransferase
MQTIIDAGPLELIACDASTLEIAISGNEALAAHLGVSVPDNWTEFGVPALQYALDKIISSEEEKNWWTYFPIHKRDNKLAGSCGYKGKPVDGIVEIGYEIAPEYRNKGLATELANALVKNAFSFPDVHAVTAHTLGEENASTKVLSKCGFEIVEEITDPDHGLVWKWEVRR